MKYICETEIIHLNFGKSEMLLFEMRAGVVVGVEGRASLLNFSVSLECFKVLWHFAFIVCPISNFTANSPQLPEA